MRQAAAGLVLLMAACAGGGAGRETSRPDSAPSLAGTSWRLGDLAGGAALPDVEATIEFSPLGQVSGRASCNRFGGTATISGETITFGPLVATRMACAEPGMSQEIAYLTALQAAERYRVEGTELEIYVKGSEKPLKFVRALGR